VIRELPVPEPRPGWVLIRVKAFGINRSELHTRLGLAWSCPAFVDTVVRRRVLLVRAAARS
jgi:NADPH:quinone reductase-like Zn-dependent oxidoreductase